MRRFWLVPAVIACVTRAMPLAAQSPSNPRAEARTNALGDPQIDVYRPSYVVVFEVVPFAGISQLYPLSSAEGAELLKEQTLTLSASRTSLARVAAMWTS